MFRPLTQDDLGGQDESERPQMPDPNFQDGSQLKMRHLRHFHPELKLKPLNEVDAFYKDTFIFIGRNGAIKRFSAKKSLFLFGPLNILRRMALFLINSGLLCLSVGLIWLLQIFYLLSNKPKAEMVHYAATAIYTFEAVVKIVGFGLILQPFSYLRRFASYIDIMILIVMYKSFAFPDDHHNYYALVVFKIFNLLFCIKGMSDVIKAVLYSVFNLRDVVILAAFVLFILALIGNRLFAGNLRQRCVLSSNHSIALNLDFEPFYFERDEKHLTCGFATYSGSCPEGYTCDNQNDENPDFGYTQYDNFGGSYINAFRMMSMDNWEDLYHKVSNI